MRARPRWLYGLAASCLVGCLVVPQSAAAAPCEPAEDDDLVLLAAPGLLTFDREATVFVEPREIATRTRIENARLEYQNSDGEVFFSHLLTSRDIADLEDDKRLRFPIRAEHGEGPLLVRLSYTQRTSFRTIDESVESTCEVERQSTVRPFAGVPPRPWMGGGQPLGNGMASFSVGVGVRCEELAPGALRVVVRHRRLKRTWRLRPGPCGRAYIGEFPRSKAQGPILPGLRDGPLDVGGFQIAARRRWTRHYRVDVLWNGETLLRRWVRIRIVSYEPARRLYERNPEFDEICLFEGSKGDAPPPRRDAQGRRYCVVGPRMFWRGRILKTRP